MDVLAIIPARGGSKRLPRKNILPIQGKPLLTYTIEHASHSTRITKTVVSTDDLEVSAVARAAGAEVVFRPQHLATDTASSEAALLHVLDTLAQQENFVPDLVVFLQCTSPIRQQDDIDRALDTLVQAGADSLVSVVRWPRFFWRLQGELATPTNYDPIHRPRTQDIGDQFMENGSIYIFKPWLLRQHHSRLGGKICLYEMDYWSSFEIDTQEDFDLCAWILQAQARQHHSRAISVRPQAVFFDFDGVFTNNMVLTMQDGSEGILADRRDGYGIGLLRKASGIVLAVLSTERNPVVAARCAKMGIPLHQGLENKLTTLKQLAITHNLDIERVVYVGNDLNDLECIQAVGYGIAVADAHPVVRAAARITLHHNGGNGAVREVCELILSAVTSHVNG
jgi:N-acylneuraminate cytidylyltransferase